MKARLLFIFITIAIDAIGIGMIIPTLPDIMRRFMSDEAAVSQYFGYFLAVYSLMQFLASPLLGGLADRFGRRPVLLISLLGGAFDYVLMAFAPSLWLLFVGRVVAGLTGANFSVAQAYMADISTDENRAANFGMIGAGFGLGFIVGPVLGGLLGAHDLAYPFLAAALLNFLNFLFGYFVLPESLPPESRRKVEVKKLNPFRTLAHVFSPSPIRRLVFVFILVQLASQVHPTIWTLFTEHRFGWSAKEVGVSLAMVGVMSAFSQGWLTGVVVKKLGEYKTALLGTFGCAVAFVCFALAMKAWMMYAILLGSSVFWVGQAPLQSLISKDIPPSEQGELQGTLVSLMSLTAIATPLLVTVIYAHFSSGPYLFAALISFIAWAVLALGKRSLA